MPIYRAATEPALLDFLTWRGRNVILVSGAALFLWLRLVFWVDDPSQSALFWMVLFGVGSLPILWYLPMILLLWVRSIAYVFYAHPAEADIRAIFQKHPRPANIEGMKEKMYQPTRDGPLSDWEIRQRKRRLDELVEIMEKEQKVVEAAKNVRQQRES